MPNLLLLLLAIFASLFLLTRVLERFASPLEPERVQRIARWIYPLAGLALVLSALRYFLHGW